MLFMHGRFYIAISALLGIISWPFSALPEYIVTTDDPAEMLGRDSLPFLSQVCPRAIDYRGVLWSSRRDFSSSGCY